MASFRFYYITMIDYQLFHLCLTFWLPFAIIVVCYAYTTFLLCKYNCETNYAERFRVRYSTKTSMSLSRCFPLRFFYSISVSDNKSENVQLNNNEMHTEELVSDCKQQQIELEPNVTQITNNNAIQTRRRNLRLKPFIVSCLIVVCYFIFWLPYSLLSLISLFNPSIADYVDNKMHVFQVFIHLNVVVSPFLYGFRM
jgi:hypothetical protein